MDNYLNISLLEINPAATMDDYVEFNKSKGTYHQSQSRALKKYYEKNKDLLNENRRLKHKLRMETDPEYKIKYTEKMKNQYLKNKKNYNINHQKDLVKENN